MSDQTQLRLLIIALLLIAIGMSGCSSVPTKCKAGETFVCEINGTNGRLAKLVIPNATQDEAESTTHQVIDKLTLDGLLDQDVSFECKPIYQGDN